MILLDRIQKELIDAVDTHAVIDRIASDFHDRVEELRKTDPVFYQMLWEYETFREYFQAANEELAPHQEVLLKDMEMALEDEIDDSFDSVEDRKMEDLKRSPLREQVLKDLAAQSMALAPGTKLSSDIIEELYADAYTAFDAYKERLHQRVLSLSPMKAYNRAEAIHKEYREQQGIVFDEEDFLQLFDERFNTKKILSLLHDRITDVLRYNRHYTLDLSGEVWGDSGENAPDTSRFPWTEPQEDEDYAAADDRLDGVLVEDGDMRDQSFTYVSELMNEYTGRRILAAENELSDESYWTTYADDFQDMILSAVEAELEAEIRYMAEEEPVRWEAFTKLCRISPEEQKDTERFLLKCDKINYGLAQRVEDLWSTFCEERI